MIFCVLILFDFPDKKYWENTDDSMVMKQLVQQIIVGDEGIEIQLQCGVSIKQEYV